MPTPSAVMVRAQDVGRSAAALLVRLTCGVVFATSGWGKLHSLPQVTDFFRALGIPWPEATAPFVAALEAGGGALLVIGLGTRWVSLPLAATMAVAIATAKRGDIDSWLDVLSLSEFTFLVLFLQLALAGPGRWSLDARRAARRGRWQTIATPPA